jgi:hypothetical protein
VSASEERDFRGFLTLLPFTDFCTCISRILLEKNIELHRINNVLGLLPISLSYANKFGAFLPNAFTLIVLKIAIWTDQKRLTLKVKSKSLFRPRTIHFCQNI